MKQEPIIFRSGEENGIVVERDHFEHSIMLNQYQQAINIFNRLWEQQSKSIRELDNKKRINDIWIDNKFSNIIAFCGDRGEGKSSCMASFATILTDGEVRTKAKKVLNFPKDEDKNDRIMQTDQIEWLDVIDPSFFDKDHNLLELLLGRICEKANRKSKEECENDCTILAKYRKLMEQLEKVKRCITTMTPQKDKKIFDSVESISELAAGMQLKDEVQTLFKCYLQLVGKECLLICVDDLDLGFEQGYRMAEMLRKYLINPYCVVLVSVKVEQLIDIIAAEHRRKVKDNDLDWEYCKQVAQKYVAKLLPRGNRVPMPSIEDICDRTIKLTDPSEQGAKLEDFSVKERVVQLIFQKTGYVFYNGQSLSPIVPTNLRALRHLLSTLEDLPDAKDKDGSDNETGRDVFKDYFFGTWAGQLPKTDYSFACQIAEYNDLSTLNATVIEYFAERVKSLGVEKSLRINEPKFSRPIKYSQEEKIDEQAGSEELEYLTTEYEQLYNDIVTRTNASVNMSMGDVMYVLWFINTMTVNKDIQNLIFLIKTVYSMRLYACYNDISVNDMTLYPPQQSVQNEVEIHRADSLYEHVNQLQRLVNGSYFSYPQRTFLAMCRDRKTLNLRKLKVKKLFEFVRDEVKKPKAKRHSEFAHTLQLCEYIALCLTRTTIEKEKDKDLGLNRSAKIPTYLGRLNSSANYAVFDFLNPFYALCSIRYAYGRMDDFLGKGLSLYDIAVDCNNSLLNKMYSSIRGGGENEWGHEHNLISDAVIRVVDVQWSIYDELLRQKRKHRATKMEAVLLAYQDINDLQIKLYPRIEIKGGKTVQSDSPYILRFEFLNVLEDFIRKIKNMELEDVILNQVTKIETPNTKKLEPEFVRTPKEVQKMKNLISSNLIFKNEKESGKNIASSISKLLSDNLAFRRKLTTQLHNLFNPTGLYSKDEVIEKSDEIINLYFGVNK